MTTIAGGGKLTLPAPRARGAVTVAKPTHRHALTIAKPARAGVAVTAPVYTRAKPAVPNLFVFDNQATLNTGRVDGWSIGSAAQASASTTHVLEGARSLDYCKATTGSYLATVPNVLVNPGGTYTLVASVYTNAGPNRIFQLGYSVSNTDNAVIVSTNWGPQYPLVSGQWTTIRRVITNSADPNATRLTIYPNLGGSWLVVPEHVWLDRIGVMPGDVPASEWSLPTASRPPEPWTDNLMFQSQATFDTTDFRWGRESGVTPLNLVRTTAESREGGACLAITNGSAAVGNFIINTYGWRAACSPGAVLSVMFSAKVAIAAMPATARRVSGSIYAYDAAGARIGTWVSAGLDLWVTDKAWHDVWTIASPTPAGTASVILRIAGYSLDPGETFYLDRCGLFLGDVRTWTAPDTPPP